MTLTLLFSYALGDFQSSFDCIPLYSLRDLSRNRTVRLQSTKRDAPLPSITDMRATAMTSGHLAMRAAVDDAASLHIAGNMNTSKNRVLLQLELGK